MFGKEFFERAILKFTHVLKSIFWGSNYFKFLIHGCCFLVWLLSILICMHPFHPYFCPCLLVWMLKYQKYWYFFCWKHCGINTKSWGQAKRTILHGVFLPGSESQNMAKCWEGVQGKKRLWVKNARCFRSTRGKAVTENPRKVKWKCRKSLCDELGWKYKMGVKTRR